MKPKPIYKRHGITEKTYFKIADLITLINIETRTTYEKKLEHIFTIVNANNLSDFEKIEKLRRLRE